MTRILVVEDNALSRELLCDWLEVEGYNEAVSENVSATGEREAKAGKGSGNAQ